MDGTCSRRRGADPNARDDKGRMPLTYAVRACIDSWWRKRRTPEVAAALLAAGATTDGVPYPTGYGDVDAVVRAANEISRARPAR